MRRLWTLITSFDTEPVELGLGLLLLVWALWLARPDVDTFGSTQSFRLMYEIGTQNLLGAWVGAENAWAVVMLLVALIKLYGLISQKLTLRRFGALLGTCIWIAIALCIGGSNPNGTGIVVYPTFAVGSVWVLWRLFRGPVRQ
jgi:hypothetical protein